MPSSSASAAATVVPMPGIAGPEHESARLRAVHRLGLAGLRVPNASFDRVVRLAARLLEAPIALFSVVDQDHQWFRAAEGLASCGTARDISFCTHAVDAHAPLLVADALQDPRFRDNPLVTGEPHIRAYLGIPVTTHDRYVVGTLCVIDTRPRSFSEAQQRDLGDLVLLLEDLLHGRDLAHYINRSMDAGSAQN